MSRQEGVLQHNLHLLASLLNDVVLPESLEASKSELLSKSQYEVLRYIDNHEHTSPAVVVRAMQISRPSVTTLLQRLEKKGWVCKQSSLKDQRGVTLSLSEAGRAVLERVEEQHRAMLGALLQRMTQAELDDLDNGLAGLLKAASGSLDETRLCMQCGKSHTNACILAKARRPGKADR